MLHVTVDVQLLPFAVRWRRQCYTAKRSWTYTFRNCFDGAAFASAVATFENNDDPRARRFDPLLKVTKFRLQPAQLRLILLRFELWFFLTVLFCHKNSPDSSRVASLNSELCHRAS